MMETLAAQSVAGSVQQLGSLEDALLLLSWLLFILIYAFTRIRPRLRVFRAPLFLLVFTATVSRLVTLFDIERVAAIVTPLFGFSVAFLIARLIVFISFDLIVDRRRQVTTPALIKSIIFFALLLVSLFVLNESLPESQRVPLTSLLASAAVVSVVLGFALQDTLGNLFSGLALHLERPIKVGHWIKVGESVGKVVETDWRAIKMRTLSHDYHILPNSMVASERIINYNDPPTPHRRELRIRAPYSASPDKVIAAALRVLRENTEVERNPEPTVLVRDFSDHWVDYEVRYWYTNYERLETIDGEVRRQVWYQFNRAGVASPLPVRDVYLHEVKPEGIDDAERREELARRMRSVPIFEALNDDELNRVIEGMSFELYAEGETIIRQGEEGDSFFVIHSGEAEVWVREDSGRSAMVKVLRAGDYFGEMALLTGEHRTATIVATSECACFVVGKSAFMRVLEANPAIAEVLSEKLSSRQAELSEQLSVLHAEVEELGRGKGQKALAKKILGKIRKYFGLE